MNRSEALRGCDQRIRAMLIARPDLPLAATTILSPVMPLFALPPGADGTRICHAVTVTAPPGVDVLAAFRDVWGRAGFGMLDFPQGLGAQDHSGFLLVMLHSGELYVISPVLTFDLNQLIGGGVVGAIVGFVAPCLVGMALQGAVADKWLYFGFLPCLLLIGGLMLISEHSRLFGVGLLIGGSLTGIATAGVCTSLFRI